jgi:hypothetical protein
VSRRVDAIGVLSRWLARAGLLALWAAVGWGTLLLLATLLGALREGPSVAVDRLLPAPGGGPWAWLNGFSAALAAVAWLLAGGLLVAARWLPRSPSGREPETASVAAAPSGPPRRPASDRTEGRPGPSAS